MTLKISLPNHQFPIYAVVVSSGKQSTVLSYMRFRRPAAGRISAAESLYGVLGMEESGSSVSGSDIKRAYKQMALKYHPDVAPLDRVEEHSRRFIMVREAYDTLSNPDKRAIYDRDLVWGRRGSWHNHLESSAEKMEWRRMWETQLEEVNKRSNCRSRCNTNQG